MGRIEKIKRQLIEEANKRLLGESGYDPTIQSDWVDIPEIPIVPPIPEPPGPRPVYYEWFNCTSDVKGHSGPVLLMFSNPSCLPCKKIKKIMDGSDEFKKWVSDNNVALLYIGCHTVYWDKEDKEKCKSKKCSDGKTMNQDYVDIMTEFGGNPNSTGMKVPDDNRWTGVPSFFMTDSSFNKKSNRIGLKTYEIKDLIEVLEKEM
jgi:thiol-disulfide isomerase/thioredoxin